SRRSRRSRRRRPATTHVADFDVAEVAGWIAPSARDGLHRRARPRTIPWCSPLATEAGQKTLTHPGGRSLSASPAALVRGWRAPSPTRSQTSCPAKLLARWEERRPFV